ncbi:MULTISPECIES: SIR2 family protein [Bacillus cereus group]|uniref:SIR2 family protein n=1 Tax=Bacillus cereus TaxID=1396 RepID=A0ABD7DDX7_BACCE|nr:MULTISPECIES: SIR2 family protein [Bacillus cereus group]MED2791392.1 SIR2 family protein [Bacillus wiedmannii]PGZ25628.1 hypothetical protein COE50_26625 [Bacillus anthracis]QRY15091.1 SIR2 family protein [Bacillus cereus]
MAEISCLSKLVNSNEYPIIFIGSGMSKRYLQNYPSWISLLKDFWGSVEPEEGFFETLNQILFQLKEKQKYEFETDLDYDTNIEISTLIERRFTEKFSRSEIHINGFSAEDAYYTKIPPFKKALSNKFSTYELIPEMQEEIALFGEVLKKSQIILTTNYDTFLEDTIADGGKGKESQVYIGQKGLFKQTTDWGEIFKIHGCTSDPESIIISKNDYEQFDKNSVLISAKIISLLLNSPIIFLGYSLTDRNIRNIIKNFSNSLTAREQEILKDRIIIVNRKEDVDDLIEYKSTENGLGCTYTVIETDNYASIYKKLLNINQGVYPSEVRKFHSLIKELIVDRGKKGSLKSVLISPQQIDELGDRINDENLVVALGDSTLIFKLPDLPTYMEDFLFSTGKIHTDVALKFATTQTPNARLPIFKFLRGVELEQTSLNSDQKQKIRTRIRNYGSLRDSIDKINNSHKKSFDSLCKIQEQSFYEAKEMDVISYNIERLNIDDIETYIIEKFKEYNQQEKVRYSTEFRRLTALFDIKKYKEEISN